MKIIYYIVFFAALIVKTITSFGDGTNNLNLSEMSLSEQESALLCKYKNIIREQDMQMMQLRMQAQQLSNQNNAIQVINRVRKKQLNDYFLVKQLNIFPK